MRSQEMFGYLDIEGKEASVPLREIAWFKAVFAENLGRTIGLLHLRSRADEWTTDPDVVRDHLRELKEAGRWNGLVG